MYSIGTRSLFFVFLILRVCCNDDDCPLVMRREISCTILGLWPTMGGLNKDTSKEDSSDKHGKEPVETSGRYEMQG